MCVNLSSICTEPPRHVRDVKTQHTRQPSGSLGSTNVRVGSVGRMYAHSQWHTSATSCPARRRGRGVHVIADCGERDAVRRGGVGHGRAHAYSERDCVWRVG
jgi:hypothetical protein